MRSWVKFLREERAVVAATTAVLMPALILFLALSVEVGEWYAVDRQLQSVADAAAVAAALELSKSGATITTAQTNAGYASAKDGYSGTPTVECLTSFNPDVTGACNASTTTGYVRAIISRSQPTMFASSFARSVTVGARAVASWTQPYQTCGLALAASGTDIGTIGAPTITLGTGCVLASDSTDPNSINLSGATSITAQTVMSAGGLTCAPTCTTVTAPVVDGPAAPNPLSCAIPANAGFCSAVTTIPAGCVAMTLPIPAPPAGGVCYTSMLFPAAAGTVSLPTGIYYTTGSFDVPVGTTLNSNPGGVTIVVTNTGIACEGNISFEGGANLAAQSAGTLGGMLFIQVAPSGAPVPCPSDAIAATATSVTLSGALYSPDATWTFNASPITANVCLTVTANVLVFGGNPDLEDAGCTAPSGTHLLNVAAISLVE